MSAPCREGRLSTVLTLVRSDVEVALIGVDLTIYQSVHFRNAPDESPTLTLHFLCTVAPFPW